MVEGQESCDHIKGRRQKPASVYRNFREAKDFENIIGELAADEDKICAIYNYVVGGPSCFLLDSLFGSRPAK